VLFGKDLFPILGGRLLKLLPKLARVHLLLVSNPWREAIEAKRNKV